MEKIEIREYRCYIERDRYRIHLLGERKKFLAELVFSDEGSEGEYHFPRREYLAVVDLLRNEKPLFIGEDAIIETMEEPVGENE